MSDVITNPIKFLGATVLSFNSTLGLGSTESTLTVDLIEDCESNPPDAFWPTNNLTAVGADVYFDTTSVGGGFVFGGVLSNWTVNQGQGGKTFNVRITDPRQLLENTALIIDTYLGNPIMGVNYINVYAAWEQPVLQGNCAVFGTSLSGERGMPYQKIIQILQGLNPPLYSPTGYRYSINFNSFPVGLPEFYRVAGPSISILQLLQDVCDVLGYEFYVTLSPGAIINIGLIDIKNQPGDFNNIITSYNGIATELSYGQELRNEKTKAVLFGEKIHYLSGVNNFDFYFGEDLINGEFFPIVPFAVDDCGFWISKKIDQLNVSLDKPIPTNGPYNISEFDIRCAMASFQIWLERVMEEKIPGSFNEAIRDNWPEAKASISAVMESVKNQAVGVAVSTNLIDQIQNNRRAGKNANMPDFLVDLQKIHQFVKNLGDTYYGKQFICRLNQTICYHQTENFSEKIFTDVPTPDGGWVNDGVPVLGLADPELGVFRQDDNRVGCFAVFSVDGEADGAGENIGKEDDDNCGSQNCLPSASDPTPPPS